MATYTINFLNNSSLPGSFCIFQQNPNTPNSSSFPLAWLVQSASPHSKVPISWNTDLYFFWAKTGELSPGIIFNAGEAFITNLVENNAVTLTKQDGNYKFIDQKSDFQKGVLRVTTDATIAFNQASISVGMSGSGTLAVQAHPNMNYSFSPFREYWIMFGDFKQGQVIDQTDIKNAVQVIFPYGIFSMNASINGDDSWTITQGLD